MSTDEQTDSGAGLAAQRTALRKEAANRGWTLVDIYEDAGASGKSMTGRRGLSAAISAVEAGDADGLMVAKLDRLSRSLLDFASLMERAQRKGWSLVALDLGVDTSTPSGEMMASVLAVFAQFERRLIGERTKAALAERRASGVKMGRPRTIPEHVRERIRRMRADGATLTAIADALNGDFEPTAHGGRRWYPATIRRVLLAE